MLPAVATFDDKLFKSSSYTFFLKVPLVRARMGIQITANNLQLDFKSTAFYL